MTTPSVAVVNAVAQRQVLRAQLDHWMAVAKTKTRDVEWLRTQIARARQQLEELDALLAENASAEVKAP